MFLKNNNDDIKVKHHRGLNCQSRQKEFLERSNRRQTTTTGLTSIQFSLDRS